MLDKIPEINLLYDFYGELLAEKQRNIIRLYYENNLSLSEVGEELGITRQGVHEALKKSIERLLSYEDRLGLVKEFAKKEIALESINGIIGKLIDEYDDEDLAKYLKDIKVIINDMKV